MDELIAYATSLIQFMESRAGSLNVETQQALGELLQQVLQLIQSEENPIDGLEPGAPPEEPGLNPAMPSSNINSFGYDEKNGRLLVKFQGDYPQENGPVYAYGGVPKNIFNLFRAGAIPARTDGKNKWGKWWKGKVPSIGASMFTLIKNGGYPYQRLT